MTSQVASEFWSEIKRYINPADREEAADILVNVLINNDEDIDDIRQAFGDDKDVKSVLSAYVDDDVDMEFDDTDDQSDYDDY
jgi:hypothetical protein